MPNRGNVLPADAHDEAIDAYRVEITGLQTQCFRLLRLIGQAVDSEMGWQDVVELQTFLREGATG